MSLWILLLTVTASFSTFGVAAYFWRLRKDPDIKAVALAIASVLVAILTRGLWTWRGWEPDIASLITLGIVTVGMLHATIRLWAGNGGRK